MQILLTISIVMLFFFLPNVAQTPYQQHIEEWHADRLERLKQPDSWLTLAGLFWLDAGKNSFGSSSANDIRFPETAPAEMGAFFLEDAQVSIQINPDVEVLHGDSLITRMALQSDAGGASTTLKWGPFTWYVIERDGRFGIRLKNSESKNLQEFNGIDRFPVSKKWRVKAVLEADSARTLQIPTVLGSVGDSPCPGALIFEIDGHTQRLYPIGTPESDSYFLIFRDATSGETTYGGGRFLGVEAVNDSGYTFIDFNKAYNPPCVFTPYATCPLPPMENELDIAVTAGEKVTGLHPGH